MYSLDEIKENLLVDFSKITNTTITDDDSKMPLSELGIDSLQFVELLIETEERYNFEFDDEKYFKDAFSSLEDIARYSSENQKVLN